jgi:hypothetical protein
MTRHSSVRPPPVTAASEFPQSVVPYESFTFWSSHDVGELPSSSPQLPRLQELSSSPVVLSPVASLPLPSPATVFGSSPVYAEVNHASKAVPLRTESPQNGASTPSRPPIVIPSSDEPSETTEEVEVQIVQTVISKNGLSRKQKKNATWTPGTKLGTVRMIVSRKEQFLKEKTEQFCKKLGPDLEKEMQISVSNLYRTLFGGKNGKGEELLGWIGVRKKYLAGRNEGTGREAPDEFNRLLDDIIEMVEEKKRQDQDSAKSAEQIAKERKEKEEFRASMLVRPSKRTSSTAGLDEETNLVLSGNRNQQRSRKRANIDTNAIMQNSREMFGGFINVYSTAATAAAEHRQEELRLRRRELEFQEMRAEREQLIVRDFSQRLTKIEEGNKRRDDEQKAQFDDVKRMLRAMMGGRGGDD